jgi:hypothetical protein
MKSYAAASSDESERTGKVLIALLGLSPWQKRKIIKGRWECVRRRKELSRVLFKTKEEKRAMKD